MARSAWGAEPGSVGAEILAAIADHYQRFVVFPSEHEPRVLALVVAHSHAIDAAQTSPLINIASPVHRCGKSTLFEVTEQLVRRPQSASNATPASIFRLLEDEGCTLLIDEYDNIAGSDPEKAAALASIFNSGYRRGPGSRVFRCEGPNNAVRTFEVFGLKYIAGISLERHLPPPTLDRMLSIRLQRKTAADAVERFRYIRVEPGATALRDRLAAWVDSVHDELSSTEPTLPDDLNDRAQEVIEPLVAIADAAGGPWPRWAREAAIALLMVPEDDVADIGLRLLADVRQAFTRHGRDVIATADLLTLLCADDEDRPWATWRAGRSAASLTPRDLANLLRPFGIKPKSVRTSFTVTAKGYTRDQFTGAWARYLEPAS